MNGRILVLLSLIGLFIAVWSQDPQPSAKAPAQPAPVVTSAAPTPPIPETTTIAVERQESIVWEGEPADIEIPDVLTAGRYRVVGTQGTVTTVMIIGPTPAEAAECPELVTRISGLHRWYFIRVREDAPIVEQTTPQAPVPAIAKSETLPLHTELSATEDFADDLAHNSKERDIREAQFRNWLIQIGELAQQAPATILATSQRLGFYGDTSTGSAALTQRLSDEQPTGLGGSTETPKLTDVPKP